MRHYKSVSRLRGKERMGVCGMEGGGGDTAAAGEGRQAASWRARPRSSAQREDGGRSTTADKPDRGVEVAATAQTAAVEKSVTEGCFALSLSLTMRRAATLLRERRCSKGGCRT